MLIKLPEDLNKNNDITALAFINGYSILIVATSDGSAHLIKLSKTDQTHTIKTIATYKSHRN